jgi:hypothetical protein
MEGSIENVQSGEFSTRDESNIVQQVFGPGVMLELIVER